MDFSRSSAFGLVALLHATGAGAATLFGPTPYLSGADLPAGFFAGAAPDNIEDFDDTTFVGGFDVRGGFTRIGQQVVFPAGEANPSSLNPTVDSVGTGGGFGGGSLAAVPEAPGTRGNRISVTFSFHANNVADLPTAAGIVWTDGPRAPYTFGFFGLDALLRPILLAEITVTLGDDTFIGTNPDGTRNRTEDRFIGLTHAGGIAAISMLTESDGSPVELDELQWGRMGGAPAPVPLPAGLPLMLGGLALMAGVGPALRRAPIRGMRRKP